VDAITSNSTRMMEKSMDYLWTKQTAILDNIANAETPNYKTKTVTFEESLQRKLESADGGERTKVRMRRAIEGSEWKVTETDESERMDDNGVDVTEQSVEMIRTAYQLQYTMKSISSDLSMIKTAIG